MNHNKKYGSKHPDDNMVESLEQTTPTHFTETALGIFKIDQVGNVGAKYVLVQVPYDPVTGQAGKVKEVCKDIREDIIDKFKVAVDDLGFFTGEKPKREL